MMDVETVGAILIMKHFTRNYLEFHDFLIQNPVLIKQIHSCKKYLLKGNTISCYANY